MAKSLPKETMNNCGPFLISLLVGGLTLRLILKRSRHIKGLFFLFLSAGLGLGISSLMTFFSFLVCGGFNRTFILAIHGLLLVVLAILNFVVKVSEKTFVKFRQSHLSYLTFILFLSAAVPVGFTLAQRHPFGDWDAWALWNMKAKFLLLSSHSWRELFSLHWHTQPDYPLLLPFMNVWGSLGTNDNLTVSPILISLIFTFSCAGLLFCGLARY